MGLMFKYFVWYKLYFFVNLFDFPLNFFSENPAEAGLVRFLRLLNLQVHSHVKNKELFVPGFISPKSILNETTGVIKSIKRTQISRRAKVLPAVPSREICSVFLLPPANCDFFITV